MFALNISWGLLKSVKYIWVHLGRFPLLGLIPTNNSRQGRTIKDPDRSWCEGNGTLVIARFATYNIVQMAFAILRSSEQSLIGLIYTSSLSINLIALVPMHSPHKSFMSVIAVSYPGFPRASLPEFIDSVGELVNNSPGGDIYEAACFHSDADGIQDIPVVSSRYAL